MILSVDSIWFSNWYNQQFGGLNDKNDYITLAKR